MRPTHKCEVIDEESSDIHYLHKLMRSLFPINNDCAAMRELGAVAEELPVFGVTSKKNGQVISEKMQKDSDDA
jgi:hypothetical protein